MGRTERHPMLNISRKANEYVQIGDVRVIVKRLGDGKVVLGIEAPREVPITFPKLPTTPPSDCSAASTSIECAQQPPP